MMQKWVKKGQNSRGWLEPGTGGEIRLLIKILTAATYAVFAR